MTYWLEGIKLKIPSVCKDESNWILMFLVGIQCDVSTLAMGLVVSYKVKIYRLHIISVLGLPQESNSDWVA